MQSRFIIIFSIIVKYSIYITTLEFIWILLLVSKEFNDPIWETSLMYGGKFISFFFYTNKLIAKNQDMFLVLLM